jgi:hypothetical protein
MKIKIKINPVIYYGVFNLLIIMAINQIADLPVWLSNWEEKAQLIANFKNPQNNFYPPGGAILLIPFLWLKPNYEIAVYFYYTVASIIYYLICKKLIINKFLFVFTLCAFLFNPYLVWLANSSQDTIFELFLVLSGAALILRRNFLLSFLPLYLLCLTRPAYWPFLLLLPFIIKLFGIKNIKNYYVSKQLLLVPILFLVTTFGINQLMFKSPALAGEAGLTAHFAHNKFFYLAMPKFDLDVFLSTGGNMETDEIISSSAKFIGIENDEFRAALINLSENPKNFLLNSVQKIDTYFFAVQKNPQLSGEYYLSKDRKSIVIGAARESWPLVIGSILYFIYRSLLLVFSISALTLLVVSPKIRRELIKDPVILFCLPFLLGSIAGILFYSETRFKIVSELILVPLIAKIFEKHKSHSIN